MFIFWLRVDPLQEKNMVIAKLNCTQMVIKGADGRLFLVDLRTPERMEALDAASPPQEGETTQNVIPFRQPLQFIFCKEA
jgi:hypothetical protein